MSEDRRALNRAAPSPKFANAAGRRKPANSGEADRSAELAERQRHTDKIGTQARRGALYDGEALGSPNASPGYLLAIASIEYPLAPLGGVARTLRLYHPHQPRCSRAWSSPRECADESYLRSASGERAQRLGRLSPSLSRDASGRPNSASRNRNSGIGHASTSVGDERLGGWIQLCSFVDGEGDVLAIVWVPWASAGATPASSRSRRWRGVEAPRKLGSDTLSRRRPLLLCASGRPAESASYSASASASSLSASAGDEIVVGDLPWRPRGLQLVGDAAPGVSVRGDKDARRAAVGR